jgi:hypothetical protein
VPGSPRGRLRPLLAALVLLAAPAVAAETPPEVRTAHFRFLPDAGATGLAANLADLAEGKRHYVLNLLGIDDPRVLTVRIGSDEDSLSRQVGTSGPVPEWIAGLAYGDEGLVVLSARGNEVFSATDTFVHELAHVYLDRALQGHHVPRWFHEGFAMLVAEEAVSDRLKAFLGAAATGSFLPLSSLEDGFPPEPPAVHLAYAQSQMFVRWLQRQAGGEGVRRLVAGLRAGMPFALAFDTTFGGAPADLFASFTRTVDPLSSWMVFLTSAAVVWVLVVVLFLWAWARKRRRAEEKRRLWALQEELRRIGTLADDDGPPGRAETPRRGTRGFGPLVRGPEEEQ